MQLRVLGPLEIVDDADRTIPLGGAQLRRALATLSLHAPFPTPIDEIRDVLWPDGAPSPNALQAVISKLRKAIAPMTIDASGSGYSLVLGPAEIDAHTFEQLVTAGRESAAAGRDGDAVDQLGHALALWRDRPFEDIADLSIGQAPAARLMAMREAAMAVRLESMLSAGQIDAAEAELESLVVAEPLVERWWALLMIALYRQDRQADALRAYQQARRVLADELGLEPGPELRTLESKILQQEASLGPSSRSTYSRSTHLQAAPTARQLPKRLASFIGRAEHIDVVCGLLAHERLVTILGPGGAGKTSLAIEVGRRSTCDSSPRQVALIELASLPRGGDVVGAAAAVLAIGDGDLRVATGPATDMQRIIDTIGNQSMLVILDNCEHVIADAATLASTLLRHCDNITLLTTSREPLAIAGEQVWNIPPLTGDEAMELLAARAASAGIELALEGKAGASAQQLLERLDGLPLAIELAAARLRSITIEDLVQRIDDRYPLLSVGPRSAEPRQQTLRGLVDWSHDLLDERERILFRRLAAFSGGATLDAIEHVCADAIDHQGSLRIPAIDIDGLISRLVDKSLVTADRTSQGIRFRMLQTMADYSSERLIASGEAESVGARHARYFASRVAPVERGLMGREQAAWIQWLRLEWANITAALDHALAIDDGETSLRLVAPLGWYFFMIDEAVAGSEWLSAALACTGTSDPRLRSLALGSCAFAASTGADPGTAAIVAERALDTLGSYDDPLTEALVAGMYVMCQLYRGRLEASRAVLPLMDDAAHRSGDRWTLAMARLVTAEVTRLQGEPAEAERDMWRAADGFAAGGGWFFF